jgi:ATP-binding cassette subfamily B (MDR/TAP) protein 1
MKDEYNKKSYESSAQVACEAAGAVRTVASLTREKDCCDMYADSLKEPIRRSTRTALWSNLLYAFSQASVMFAIALVFWYGSVGVANQEYGTTAFFVAIMVCSLMN